MRCNDVGAKTIQELNSVEVILEDSGSIHTPDHDMVQGAGHVQSGFSWHVHIL
jgi:hypothetical protein